MTSALPPPPTKTTLISSCAQIFCSLQCHAGCKTHVTSITKCVGCNHPPHLRLIFPIKLRTLAVLDNTGQNQFLSLNDFMERSQSQGPGSPASSPILPTRSLRTLTTLFKEQFGSQNKTHTEDSYRHPHKTFTLLLKHSHCDPDRQHHSSCTAQLPGAFGKQEQSKDEGTPQTCSWGYSFRWRAHVMLAGCQNAERSTDVNLHAPTNLGLTGTLKQRVIVASHHPVGFVEKSNLHVMVYHLQ